MKKRNPATVPATRSTGCGRAGIAKDSLHIEDWIKDVAPSNELRRWFGHDPRKWNEFHKKYFAELKANPDAWAALANAAKKRSITLVYSANDAEHNNAVALAEFLKNLTKLKADA